MPDTSPTPWTAVDKEGANTRALIFDVKGDPMIASWPDNAKLITGSVNAMAGVTVAEDATVSDLLRKADDIADWLAHIAHPKYENWRKANSVGELIPAVASEMLLSLAQWNTLRANFTKE